MSGKRQVVEADLVWTGRGFEAGLRVAIGSDGRIEAVGSLGEEPTRRLGGRALLPGFVNAHSHAFQRGLRGRGEVFPAGSGSFWTWREAMYGLVGSIDRRRLRELSLRAFFEMRDAGITAVGEFHYLHHDEGLDWAFDEVVLDAAAEAGLRIALLVSYYRTGGIGEPLDEARRRFATPSPEEFWERIDALVERIDPETRSIGIAPHSVRAATPEEIAALHEEARRRGMVVHVHLEERREEVEACREAYGTTPSAALLDALGDDADGLVAVHCTHTRPADLKRLLAAGGRVCACPLTEANLGDGIPDLGPALEREGRLSLGTDSNARIALVEEMRWLEYGQRLRRERRGVLADEGGDVARRLLSIATAGGAAALGLEAGAIEPGRPADLVALDLGHPSLAEATPGTLLGAWVFGGGNDAVAETCVGGRW
ncbi:MAG: formimidoylglutamate deiminase [Gemmatimonadota bacterium]|nr:formimidoylglutamate deiminase [Gemmatimonadota bacterium]